MANMEMKYFVEVIRFYWAVGLRKEGVLAALVVITQQALWMISDGRER